MQNKRSKKINKKITTIIISLILIIPAVSVLVVLLNYNPGKLKSKNITEIKITSPEGVEFSYTDSETILLYSEIFNSGKEIEKPAKSPEEYKKYKIEVIKKGDDILCDMLITDSPDDCLLCFTTDDLIKYSTVPSEKAKLVLMSDEFATAYTYYMPPKAQIIINDIKSDLLPYEMNWNFRRIDNNFFSADTKNIISGKTDLYDYKPPKRIEINFELVPDSVAIQIFDGDESVFSDRYDSENYTNFTYKKKTTLQYVFTAEWFENEAAKYHGSAIYKVNINYNVNPEGILSTAKMTQGEFIALNVYNTAQEDILSVQDEQSLSFYSYNDSKLLFYPSYAGGFIGQRTLSVIDDNNYKIDNFIEIAMPEAQDQTVEKTPESPNELYVLDQRNAGGAPVSIRTHTGKKANKLWEGTFALPLQDPSYIINYAAKIVSNGAQIGNYPFLLLNSANLDVKAAGGGVVTFAGVIEPFGNTVIIDHGLGIATFYSNLETLFVNQDDNVTKELKIAEIKPAAEGALRYGVIVNGYFVNPDKLNACLELARLI